MFLKEGAEAHRLTAAQFAKVVAGDVDRWKKLAKEQNIVVD